MTHSEVPSFTPIPENSHDISSSSPPQLSEIDEAGFETVRNRRHKKTLKQEKKKETKLYSERKSSKRSLSPNTSQSKPSSISSSPPSSNSSSPLITPPHSTSVSTSPSVTSSPENSSQQSKKVWELAPLPSVCAWGGHGQSVKTATNVSNELKASNKDAKVNGASPNASSPSIPVSRPTTPATSIDELLFNSSKKGADVSSSPTTVTHGTPKKGKKVWASLPLPDKPRRSSFREKKKMLRPAKDITDNNENEQRGSNTGSSNSIAGKKHHSRGNRPSRRDRSTHALPGYVQTASQATPSSTTSSAVQTISNEVPTDLEISQDENAVKKATSEDTVLTPCGSKNDSTEVALVSEQLNFETAGSSDSSITKDATNESLNPSACSTSNTHMNGVGGSVSKFTQHPPLREKKSKSFTPHHHHHHHHYHSRQQQQQHNQNHYGRYPNPCQNGVGHVDGQVSMTGNNPISTSNTGGEMTNEQNFRSISSVHPHYQAHPSQLYFVPQPHSLHAPRPHHQHQQPYYHHHHHHHHHYQQPLSQRSLNPQSSAPATTSSSGNKKNSNTSNASSASFTASPSQSSESHYRSPYLPYRPPYMFGNVPRSSGSYHRYNSAPSPNVTSPSQLSSALPPAPTTYPPTDKELIKKCLQAQIEYYFSIENLCKDIYIRQHMDAVGGWVVISFLANFNRIKLLTDNPDVLLDALLHSEVVEVNEETKQVRRRGDWERWVLPVSPLNASEKTSSPIVSTKSNIEKLSMNDSTHTAAPIHGDLSSESSSLVAIQENPTTATSDIAATAS